MGMPPTTSAATSRAPLDHQPAPGGHGASVLLERAGEKPALEAGIRYRVVPGAVQVRLPGLVHMAPPVGILQRQELAPGGAEVRMGQPLSLRLLEHDWNEYNLVLFLCKVLKRQIIKS